MKKISYYTSVKETKTKLNIEFELFLEDIRNGRWKNIVEPIRAISDKDARNDAKLKAPCVTISGTFKERTDSGIICHSGYIPIDIDDVEDVNQLKSIISHDKYVVAAFTSISGRGLCVIFKVNPEKHREAFQGIGEYLYRNYKVVYDPTSINVSRVRFVSYDPEIFISNGEVETFVSYPKNIPPKKIEKTIFVQSDFDLIIEQIQSRRINLCENYHDWLRICFALCHHFGEAGREYFHIVSQYSTKYDRVSADKQYTACLKDNGNRRITIGTFYYYCKQAGIRTYSERTRKIAYSATYGKKSGLSPQQVADNLEKFEDIIDSIEIVQQVMDNDIEVKGEDSIIDQLELWLRQNYDLKRNEITRYIENDGVIIQQKELNSIFIKAKKILGKVSFEIVDRMINSDFIEGYNPFYRFFDQHKQITTTGHIDSLFDSVNAKDNQFLHYFGKKWLVSLISSMHGEHSPLMLVFTGEQSTGKTEFFRRLLPKELKDYYGESKLDAGKDDEILMTQKILIMDDEMGGKSKKESKRLKELTSKQTFSLREPYGRNNVDLNRLAVLCGTTNDNEILNDPTGNRRIIPIQVKSIDHAAYNSVDKIALLMEAYNLWKSGFNWKLDKNDIEYLGTDKNAFEVTSLEAELVSKYFEPADGPFGIEYMTCSDIKVHIEGITKQKLSLDKLGKELKRLGFQQQQKRVGISMSRVYKVSPITPDITNSSFEAPF